MRFFLGIMMFLCFSVFFLSAPACSYPDRHERDEKGVVKIKNETKIDFYIVIDDYNQGNLSANDSKEYKVSFGDVKLVAEYGDKIIKKYVTINRGNRFEEWVINDSEVEDNTKDKNPYW